MYLQEIRKINPAEHSQCPAEIQSENFLNRSLECYCYTSRVVSKLGKPRLNARYDKGLESCVLYTCFSATCRMILNVTWLNIMLALTKQILLMKFMKLCYFLLYFLCLTRHELQRRQVARSMFFGLIVTKLSYRKDYSGLIHSFKNIERLILRL